jgi:membrane-associated phospholipid phosphatase
VLSRAKSFVSAFAKLIRAEDVIVLAVGLALVLFAGVSAVLGGIRINEDDWGALTFVLAPACLMVFALALRYAVRGGDFLSVGLGPLGRVLRDWSPFFFFLVIYGAFSGRLWMRLLPGDRDAELLALDRAAFGETPSVLLQDLLTPVWTDLLAAAYFLHLVLPPLVALVWYLRSRSVFREFLLSVMTASLLAMAGYMAVPAVGPGYAYRELYAGQLQGMVLSRPVAAFMDLARAPRDAFPSLHVGLSGIVLFYAWRLGRKWGLALTPLVLGNWAATILLRYHYLVDVGAGLVVTALAVLSAKSVLRAERWLRSERTPTQK